MTPKQGIYALVVFLAILILLGIFIAVVIIQQDAFEPAPADSHPPAISNTAKPGDTPRQRPHAYPEESAAS